jgi:hypothetical protein
MIDDLDETLRQLLIRELPIKNREIDISFDQPKREWSAKLSRPTLNLFLYDLRENTRLRQTTQEWEVRRLANGATEKRRRVTRIDLHYIITAWATEPEDEHRLLGRTTLALLRTPQLPDDLMPDSLKDQPSPISLHVAQSDGLDKPTDLWNVLDNQMRPAITCIVTVSMDPYTPLIGGIVRTREIRFGQLAEPASEQKMVDRGDSLTYWTIGGRIRSKKVWNHLRITVVERGLDVPLQADGRFSIGHLQAGAYTLEITADGRETSRHKIAVPSPDYEIQL